ncbi:hypothetical protein PAPYR_10938 [Paratrimastix pyriformis]|uniref:Uncharacterized protein n=1 Tax=Paratrimastix pyriformis TaxID=342808 RepID=A0ABQ8U4V5_9EUKA|nr:hypothetical protein PAPYR_10938 [Paratrimastix pyriformis]
MRCDLLIAQKDKSTAGTDMTCQILFDQFLDVSAVLRACCASVHSFLVWENGALQVGPQMKVVQPQLPPGEGWWD